MSATVRLEVSIDLRSPSTMERGHHEVRAVPATSPVQRPTRTSLLVEPAGWCASHLDHWGTRVSALEVDGPHDRLTITSTSVVEVDRAASPLPGGSWEDVRAAADGTAAEHLAPHPASPRPTDLVGAARGMLFDGATPDDVGLALCSLVRSHVGWDAGADEPLGAARAWSEGVGTAADLTHLALAALRSVGIPARAVVGFVHPDPAGSRVALGHAVVAGTHSWVEWFSGDWFAVDVARGEAAGDLHVAIGHGRAVSDVPVLRGVTGSSSPGSAAGVVDVTAAMTRLA